MAKLVCMTGAGGTGKTTVLKALKSLVPRIEEHGSIVREFYASRGLTNEREFHRMTAAERRDFQLDLFDYYVESLESAVKNAKSPVVVCDRSVFDHYAYTLYGTREQLNEDGLDRLEWGVARFKALNPDVYYFPYPAPWSYTLETEDGFRAVEPAKDLIIDAVIFRQLNKHVIVWSGTVGMNIPERRAAFIYEDCIADVLKSRTAFDLPKTGSFSL